MGLGVAVHAGGAGSAALTEAASRLRVHQRIDQPTLYELELGFGVDAAVQDFPTLLDSELHPPTSLAMVAEQPDGQRVCLAQGPVTGQRIQFARGGDGSRCVVRGADRQVELDREATIREWIGTDATVAAAVLAGYAPLVPNVQLSGGSYSPDGHTLIQRGTDLQLIRQLARRNGAHFWIETDGMLLVDTGVCRAPDLAAPETVTFRAAGDDANVGEVELEWDVERPTEAVAAGLDLAAKQTIDAAPQTPYHVSGLGNVDLATAASSTVVARPAAVADTSDDLSTRAESALMEAGWFVRVRLSTNLNRLGSIPRAHGVAMVQGLGSRHSGRYYIAEVLHEIDTSDHVMTFELWRNAWES